MGSGMNLADEKYKKLQEYLKSLGSVAVAFSGGVDSVFLLRTAHDVLKDNAMAVTASARAFPKRELREAEKFCEQNGIRQEIYEFHALDVKGFSQNPMNRCYLCKHALFEGIWKIAQNNGIQVVAEGSNVDDEGDYRPGLLAVKELGVKSPLREAGLTKAEIRTLSKRLGLPAWDKPSFACLASRFVYGEAITKEKLDMVDRAEQLLLDKGFLQVRVRMHGDMARIEVLPEELERLVEPKMREQVFECFKKIGFSYVTLDLGGYRTGSMNEMIEKNME